MKPTILRADGPAETAPKPNNGTDYKLDELRAIVGGSIECVWPEDGTIIVLHGEGKLLGLPVNQAATMVAKNGIAFDDYIVGDVLHCPVEMVK